jgi:tetratricopeptide (TPR) repeat protein
MNDLGANKTRLARPILPIHLEFYSTSGANSMLGLGIFATNAIGRCFMLTPFRVNAAIILLVFAGLLYSQPQAAAPAVEQLQGTLRRLQAEIKNLQDTIVLLKQDRKTDSAAAAAPGAPSTQNPTPTSTQDPATRAKQARATYNEARRLEDQRLYRAAVDEYAEAIQLDPLNDAAFLHRGYSFHQLGDYAAATADFTQSLAL